MKLAAHHKSYQHKLILTCMQRVGQAQCSLQISEQVSIPLVVAGIAGVALFFNAELLSQSMSFRVTTGSLVFVLLAVLVLVFMLAR